MSTENKSAKRGRPVVSNSARQAKLAARAERVANGGSISKGRPANPNSKRQARLAAQEARKASGIEIKVGRPKGSKKEAVAEEYERKMAELRDKLNEERDRAVDKERERAQQKLHE